jgi:hypothetical protein
MMVLEGIARSSRLEDEGLKFIINLIILALAASGCRLGNELSLEQGYVGPVPLNYHLEERLCILMA